MSVMSCNDHEVPELIEFARRKQVDISFIEEMPLGIVSDIIARNLFAVAMRFTTLSPDTINWFRQQRIPGALPANIACQCRMPDSPVQVGFMIMTGG